MVNKTYPRVGWNRNTRPYGDGPDDQAMLFLQFPLSLGVCAVTGRHSFPSNYPDVGGQAGHAHTQHPDRWVCLPTGEVTWETAVHEMAHLLDPGGGRYHSFGWRMMMKQFGAEVPLRYKPWLVRKFTGAKVRCLQWRIMRKPGLWEWPYRFRWYRRMRIGVPLKQALRRMTGEPR